jgi:hypothetical protein
MNAMIIGGVCFAIAAVCTIFVVTYKRNIAGTSASAAVAGH